MLGKYNFHYKCYLNFFVTRTTQRTKEKQKHPKTLPILSGQHFKTAGNPFNITTRKKEQQQQQNKKLLEKKNNTWKYL